MSKFLQQIQIRERDARRGKNREEKKSSVGDQGSQLIGKEHALGGGVI